MLAELALQWHYKYIKNNTGENEVAGIIGIIWIKWVSLDCLSTLVSHCRRLGVATLAEQHANGWCKRLDCKTRSRSHKRWQKDARKPQRRNEPCFEKITMVCQWWGCIYFWMWCSFTLKKNGLLVNSKKCSMISIAILSLMYITISGILLLSWIVPGLKW